MDWLFIAAVCSGIGFGFWLGCHGAIYVAQRCASRPGSAPTIERKLLDAGWRR